jgi:predicted nucleotidyltransferase
MTKTADLVTDEEMAVYRATARRQRMRERQELRKRAERAKIVAQRAARLLKDKAGARRVILFGSLARGELFHQRSDVDLAVEGIKSQDFWYAWAELDNLNSEFEIDLVHVETAPPNLLLTLEREGVDL